MDSNLADIKQDSLLVRNIIEDIIREGRDLYQYIKDRPDATIATKRRLSTVISTITTKVLDRLGDLDRADTITKNESQVIETADFIGQFLEYRAGPVAE